MPETDKTIFISYRRSVTKYLALSLYEKLHALGYDVFLDRYSIGAGRFEDIILKQIESRYHFIVLLTHGTLDRCTEPGDWLRREIETAIEKGCNVIPVLVDCFTFEDAYKHLTGGLSALPNYNGVPLYIDYIDAGIERLCAGYLNTVPQREDAPPPPPQPILPAAPMPAPEPQPETKRSRKGEKDAATILSDLILQSVSESRSAPRGKPEEEGAPGAEARAGDAPSLDEFSLDDVELSLHELMPEDGDAEAAPAPELLAAEQALIRGMGRRSFGDMDGAMIDYNQAVALNPARADIYINRAELHFAQGDFQQALDDFQAAQQIDPANPTSTGGIAITQHALGDAVAARQLWQSLLDQDANYQNPTWVQMAFQWDTPLIDEVQKVIGSIG